MSADRVVLDPAYEVVLYHDTDLDAATATRVIDDTTSTPEAAIHLAQESLSSMWQTATVHEGRLLQRHPFPRPVFVDGEKRRWYVGPTWVDEELTPE